MKILLGECDVIFFWKSASAHLMLACWLCSTGFLTSYVVTKQQKNFCCYLFRWDSFGNQLSFKTRNDLVFHYVRWTEHYNNAHICVDGKRALSSTSFQTHPCRLLTGLAACSYSPDPIIFRSFWFGAKLVHKPWPSFLLRLEGDAESVTAAIWRLGRTDLRWSPRKHGPSQVKCSSRTCSPWGERRADCMWHRGVSDKTRLACAHRLYKSEDSHVVNGTHVHTPV